ncbi:MAG: 4-alpha-glucanotransferase [Dehalococcoidia bacterium]|nr:4-alpha-glucanotransferase [Dehalococcoidia bacterium]
MTAGNEPLSLQNLARAYGVETDYRDNNGRRQEASPEALLAVLKALGAPVEGSEDISAARRERRLSYWRQPLDPVVVSWDGAPTDIDLRLPSDRASGTAACHLKFETGEVREWGIDLSRLPTLQQATVEGATYTVKSIALPQVLPMGYHRLTVEAAGRLNESLFISAPAFVYSPYVETEGREWGSFLPLYALYSKRSWGSGDFSDLETFMGWVSGLGGNFVATLPFLASFLDKPCDPSPYKPVSRLFWNEFYIDVTKVPEMALCPEAIALAESTEFREEIESLNRERLVDYRRGMALKRAILERLAKRLGPDSGERWHSFQGFVRERDGLLDYARFRATVEFRGETWRSWPHPLRDGLLQRKDFGKETQHYHAYVQWLADEQLARVSGRVREKGVRLYLDLPLGVHPDGYDTWRQGDLFVSGVSAGAPPDALFHKGQNWGFPPVHPQKMREQGYRYAIAYLDHHMKYADVLRVDHVMGLHHLFWVPQGMEAAEGVYVRCPADEMYAILSVESHRHQCQMVGENLGTVPPYVNNTMAQHGVHGLYVAQYEVPLDPNGGLRDIPPASVASLNTHDMPPFAAFWQGLEIERWHALGLITEAEAKTRTEDRHAAKRVLVRFLMQRGYLKGDPGDVGLVFRACLSFLADSPSRMLMVNMEDLWLETEQQNVPGVVEGHPNWQRKAWYDFETFSRMTEVVGLLRLVNQARQTGEVS